LLPIAANRTRKTASFNVIKRDFEKSRQSLEIPEFISFPEEFG
jgi:hypothetical protein